MTGSDPTVDALAAALYRVMPTTGHWIGPSIEVATGSTAAELAAALADAGYVVVPAEDVEALAVADLLADAVLTWRSGAVVEAIAHKFRAALAIKETT